MPTRRRWQMLDPGAGKTHWRTCGPTPIGVSGIRSGLVIYDFADSRAGEHARAFLGTGEAGLVCDDSAAGKAL